MRLELLYMAKFHASGGMSLFPRILLGKWELKQGFKVAKG